MYWKPVTHHRAMPTFITSLFLFLTLFVARSVNASGLWSKYPDVSFNGIYSAHVSPSWFSAQRLKTHDLSLQNQHVAHSEQAKQLNAEGIAALERGDESAAQKLFQVALKVNPNDVTAHTYLGVLADRSGALSEAERHFAAAARFDPDSSSARNNYGAILLRLNQPSRAATEFEASLRLDANQPSALVNLAQIHFASNTPEGLRRARDLFERARSLAPDSEIARALVIINLRLGASEAAAANYRDYRARLATSTDASTKLAATRFQLGSALLDAGLSAEATEELNAAVTADPSNVEAIVLLARAYLARKDVPAAGRTLESAVARRLDDARLYAALADVYEAAKRPENAIPAMRLAIARNPKSEAYRFRYAMLLTDTKAPAAAVIRLQEALREFPQSSRLWFALGVAHAAENKTEEATRAFTRAFELDPKMAPALAYLGNTYAERGQYADAVALYERALTIDETMAVVHYLAADALLKESTTDAVRVEKHLSRALALDPSLASARLALAKLYLRTNRVDEAASQLERAIAFDPNLAEAHYQLGRAYMRLKRTPQAQTELAIFKRLSDAEKEQSQTARREIVRRLANVRF
jgi:tetratricopeptide (TPR) repeat protein